MGCKKDSKFIPHESQSYCAVWTSGQANITTMASHVNSCHPILEILFPFGITLRKGGRSKNRQGHSLGSRVKGQTEALCCVVRSVIIIIIIIIITVPQRHVTSSSPPPLLWPPVLPSTPPPDTLRPGGSTQGHMTATYRPQISTGR